MQYFCDNKDEKRNTAVAIIRGLIFQLLNFQPNLFDHILPSFKIQGGSLFADSSFETLWRIFNNMLRDPVLSIGPRYCILDGLDEIDEASLEILLGKIKSLFSVETRLFHRLKMIVVSRDLPKFIPELLTGVPRIRLDPDADSEINADLQRFINDKVERLPAYNLCPESLRVHVKKLFRERAQGTFLWVALVAKALTKCEVTEIKQVLEQFPPGLDELYARMLLQIDINRRELVAKILLWVVLAARPLTLSELGTAVGISNGTPNDFSLAQVARDQVSYCGSFLTIRSDEVGLIHQSAKDYRLRKTVDLNPDLEAFRVKEEAGNLEVARKCLEYLQNGSFAKGKIDLSEDTEHLRAFPLIRYAALHWPDHARALLYPGDIFNLSRPFFSKRCLIRESWLRTYWASEEFGEPPRSFTLLHIASYFGILSLAEDLFRKRGWINRLRRVYNVDKRDGDGKTALIWAASNGQKAVVQLLLDKEADIEAKDTYGRTALFGAASRGHEAVVQLLLDQGANIEAKHNNGWTALLVAALSGYKTAVQLLLDKEANIEAKDNDGWTALLLASVEGHETIVQLLLDKGANIEAKDNHGWTALWGAALGGYKAVVQLLLENRANIEAKDVYGDTALLLASSEVHKDVVQLLLDNGANIEAKGVYGKTASPLASSKGHEDVVRLLLENGANIEAKDNVG
jgi:ankyrin repeat protein